MNTYQTIDPKLEFLAALMDDKLSIFGFRIGLNFIIDLIPGIGDILTTMIALYIFSVAWTYKLPKSAYIAMLINIAIYFLLGLIPFLGDIFGAVWKPNRRNINILRRHIAYQNI